MSYGKTKKASPSQGTRDRGTTQIRLFYQSKRPYSSINGEPPLRDTASIRLPMGYARFHLKLKDPFDFPITPVYTNHRLSAVMRGSLLVPVIAIMICFYYTFWNREVNFTAYTLGFSWMLSPSNLCHHWDHLKVSHLMEPGETADLEVSLEIIHS
jgi:hypothetical protein